MQNLVTELSTVSYVIQLAVAPAFLLTGIGATLSVFTVRLARVVDRYRILIERNNQTTKHIQEIHMLAKRAVWVHWAITLCSLSALLLATVIVALFVCYESRRDPSHIVSPLFIMAMISFILALISFLREISLSTHTIALPEEFKES